MAKLLYGFAGDQPGEVAPCDQSDAGLSEGSSQFIPVPVAQDGIAMSASSSSSCDLGLEVQSELAVCEPREESAGSLHALPQTSSMFSCVFGDRGA